MAKFLYFDQNYQKQGPVSEERLKELAAQGLITPNTPVESDTGHRGVAGQLPGLFSEIVASPSSPSNSPIIAPPPTQPDPAPTQSAPVDSNRPDVGNTPSNAAAVKKLKTYFAMFSVCLVVGVPLILAYGLGLLLVLASFVYWNMLLYQLWKQIPADIARTTPGKAVGFLFIPLFNLYWCFVAFSGLCKDMDKVLQQRGIQYQVNKGLGTTMSILFIAFVIFGIIEPIVIGSMICIACAIIGFFFMKSVLGGATALLE